MHILRIIHLESGLINLFVELVSYLKYILLQLNVFPCILNYLKSRQEFISQPEEIVNGKNSHVTLKWNFNEVIKDNAKLSYIGKTCHNVILWHMIHSFDQLITIKMNGEKYSHDRMLFNPLHYLPKIVNAMLSSVA